MEHEPPPMVGEPHGHLHHLGRAQIHRVLPPAVELPGTAGAPAEHLERVEMDVDGVRVLRSVLMKPEHEPFVPWLHERVSALVRDQGA